MCSRYGARGERVGGCKFDSRPFDVVGGVQRRKLRSNSPCLAGARGWVDETEPIEKAEQLVFCGPRSNFTLPSKPSRE
jgi:hypothetical protein